MASKVFAILYLAIALAEASTWKIQNPEVSYIQRLQPSYIRNGGFIHHQQYEVIPSFGTPGYERIYAPSAFNFGEISKVPTYDDTSRVSTEGRISVAPNYIPQVYIYGSNPKLQTVSTKPAEVIQGVPYIHEAVPIAKTAQLQTLGSSPGEVIQKEINI